jgi:hypothetical protein
VVIRVLDYLDQCITHEDGMIICSLILPAMQRGEIVTISFDGVRGVPTSFVNAAFIELLKDIPFDIIKQKLIIKQSNRQINELIKKRFSFETQKNNTSSIPVP